VHAAQHRSAGTRPPRASADAVTALTGFLILLFAIPSRLIIAPLGGAGSPAQLLGVAALLWWAASRLARGSRLTTVQPVRWAMSIFVVAVLLSYVAATVRPIDEVELRAADRGLLSLLSWLGIVLLACDGIPSRDRLDTLLRRLVLAGGGIALLGLLQFFTGMSFINYIQIPGLSQNIRVRSIVGRFLEHSRAWYFRNGGHEEIYVGSADLMSRNLDDRVEVMVPIADPALKQRVLREILGVYLADNVKARELRPDGSYVRVPRASTELAINCQEHFI